MVQIKGRDGSELIDPFTLTISKEGEIAKPDGVFLDDEIRLQLQIIKTDEKTGHRVTMSSASFKLRDYKGNPVYQEVVNKEGNPEKTDTFVTNNQGMVTLPAALATGKYTIEEIKAPDGYMLQENPMSITISRSAVNGNTVELVKDKLLRVRFPNKAIEGKITVYKTGDIFKGLQLKEEHGETVTKAIFEKGYLSDVGFDIVAANDIVDPANGQVLYEAGKTVDTLITDDKGKATSQLLPLGKYLIKETNVAEGYVASEMIPVTLSTESTQSGDDGQIVSVEESVHNQYQPVSILLKKLVQFPVTTIEQLEGYEKVESRISEKPAAGFVFGLFTDQAFDKNGKAVLEESEDEQTEEGKENADSKILIPKNTLMMTAVSDEEGRVEFKGDVPHGNYYIKELTKKEEYIPNNKKFRWIYQHKEIWKKL